LAGLLEQGVDERGLAVIDVGNDRDVTQVVADRENAVGRGRDRRRRCFDERAPSRDLGSEGRCAL
jgi:hypothetical protein